MKILNIINLTLLVVIILGIIIGIINKETYSSTLFLGLFILPVFQLITGFIWLVGFKESRGIQMYFYTVIGYFFLIFSAQFWLNLLGQNFIIEKIAEAFIIIIPLFLIIYFTIILNNFSRSLSFLRAKWKNLALVNYEVDANILEKHLPKGTEIDYYNGKCYVSLVGFMFQNTKIMGIKILYHVNFEEVNLRFYVKRFENNEWKRGVVFIKEIVPKHALTIVANMIYKEHYQTLPMKHSVLTSKNTTDFEYQWKLDNKWNSVVVKAKNELLPIEENSEAEFICEHYFGYTKYNNSTTFEYEVKHPRWEQYEVIETKVAVDFETVYGTEFAHLENVTPCSVILAKGSIVSVENKRKIK